jgi:hypothetical protein
MRPVLFSSSLSRASTVGSHLRCGVLLEDSDSSGQRLPSLWPHRPSASSPWYGGSGEAASLVLCAPRRWLSIRSRSAPLLISGPVARRRRAGDTRAASAHAAHGRARAVEGRMPKSARDAREFSDRRESRGSVAGRVARAAFLPVTSLSPFTALQEQRKCEGRPKGRKAGECMDARAVDRTTDGGLSQDKRQDPDPGVWPG